MLKHLLATHLTRIDDAEAWTNAKAARVWAVVDAHPTRYRTIPDKSARSRTTMCFRVLGDDNGNGNGGHADEAAEKAFVAAAEERGMTGLKGHRAIGGIRVGNFNSVSEEGVARLVRFMEEFAAAGGT